MTTAVEPIGRRAELRALADALDADGAALLLVGEPGVGTTTLLAGARALAEGRGASVLATSGVEPEQAVPYLGLARLLDGVLGDLGPGRGAAGSDGGAARDRADASAARHRLALLTALGLDDGPPPSPFLVAQAVLDLLADTRARGPVVLLVDDLHWVDAPSREVVALLARRAADARLTVLGAASTAGGAVDAGIPTLEVGGLADEPALTLLERRGLTADEQRRIVELARGNPLALLELPVDLDPGTGDAVAGPSLPERLEHVFAARHAGLPPHVRDAVLVAAVHSGDAVDEVVAAAAMLGGAATGADVLQPAVAAGLVLVAAGRVRFRHPLVRSGVAAHEGVARRRAAHRALAATLLGTDPFRRTWHRAQSVAGPHDEIADELEASVPAALGRGAVMTAVATLERAAELSRSSPVRGRRVLLAAEYASAAGRRDVVQRLVADASRARLAELDRARLQWLRAATDEPGPGDTARALALADLAGRTARDGDVDLALDLLLSAAVRCWSADPAVEVGGRVAGVLTSLPRASRSDPRWTAALALAEPIRRAAELIDQLGAVDLDGLADARALRLLGVAAHALGETPLAADLLDRAAAALREERHLGLLRPVLVLQAETRQELGDWAGAAYALREIALLDAETVLPVGSPVVAVLEARQAALTGDPSRALELLARTGVEAEADARAHSSVLCLALVTRGTALLTAGRHLGAYAHLSRVLDPADPAHHERQSLGAVALLAEAALGAGQEEAAREVVARAEALARTTPSALLQVQLGYARAVLAPHARADHRFHAALSADLRAWPWPRARLRAAYGAWLLRHGRTAEAHAQLRGALATFDALGARPWSAGVRALLGEPTEALVE